MNTNDFNLKENADIVALAMDASKSLDSRPLKEWFDKKYSNTETRVYVYDVEATDENFELIPIEDITDEEFMEEAEKQGRVYTLKGFEKALNETGEINTNTDIIRFIQVPVSE